MFTPRLLNLIPQPPSAFLSILFCGALAVIELRRCNAVAIKLPVMKVREFVQWKRATSMRRLFINSLLAKRCSSSSKMLAIQSLPLLFSPEIRPRSSREPQQLHGLCIDTAILGDTAPRISASTVRFQHLDLLGLVQHVSLYNRQLQTFRVTLGL